MALPIIAGIGALAGMASAGIGAASSAADRHQALAAAEGAVREYLSVLVPDPAQQKLILERYQSTGKLDPILQQVVKQAQTKLTQVQRDPSLKAAQLKALRSLSDISDRGGRTLEQDAYLNEVQNDVAADNRGKIGAIKSSFASRGMGQPGGLEMVANLSNAQNETQRLNDASLKAASQAQVNALRAIASGGELAGKMRSQDFEEESRIAAAQDDIERFNTAALNSVNANNVGIRNRAAERNLDMTQDLANKNTDQANAEQIHNKGLIQQEFDNRMKKAAGMANARLGVANQHRDNAKTTAGMWSGIGQGAAKAGASAQMWADRNDDEDEDESEESQKWSDYMRS